MLLLPACQHRGSGCSLSTGTHEYLTVSPGELPTPVHESSFSPFSMEIGGRTMKVDKVVEGPLCNDNWSGIVYVACNVQIYQWTDQPIFLKGCNLTIEPGTVVYVAYHNDEAYYNGCSCHTGETAEP